MLCVLASTVALLAVLYPARASQAAPADKTAVRSAAPVAKPVSPITVNVNVNVRVSHDTRVDVNIGAPFTPIVGSVQIPDFVQHLLSGFFKAPASSTPKAAPPSGSYVTPPGRPAAK
jgi:hypothetical protein